MLSMEKLLTREQKEAVVMARLIALAPRLNGEVSGVTYDRRFGFDFEVVKGPGGKARVTFSLSIEEPRFMEVVRDCAQACLDIRFTTVAAKAIRGNTTEFGRKS